MKNYFLGFIALLLVGAGCLGGVKVKPIADASCDAYATNETIVSEEDKELFRGLCYTEKAVATSDVGYCLSLEGFEKGDCISYLSAKLGQVEMCETYIPKSESSERYGCRSHYAMVKNAPEACDLTESDVQQFCREAVEGCQSGAYDGITCVNNPGPHLYCDGAEDASLVGECETTFPLGAYSTYR